jgi:3-oxoacyl-(acyl-carrier-protein) synthase III
MAQNAVITGWGYYTPSKVVTNFDLEKIVDTSDEWITSRTGIKERRYAADGETTSSMSLRAGRLALEKARLRPQDLDLVIVATCSPDYIFPATACMVQDALGAERAGAFDIEAACTGFVSGHGPERARHRRRDPLAVPQLERPLDLRPVRRRRGRRRDRSVERLGRYRVGRAP